MLKIILVLSGLIIFPIYGQVEIQWGGQIEEIEWSADVNVIGKTDNLLLPHVRVQREN